MSTRRSVLGRPPRRLRANALAVLLLALAAPVPAALAADPWVRLKLTVMSDSATVVLRDPQHRLAWACDTASFTGIPACSTRVHRVVPTRNLGLGSVADFEVAMPQQGSWRLTVRSNRPRVPGRTSDFFVQAVVRDASGHDNDGEVFGNFLPPNSDSLRWDVVIRSSGKHYYLPGFELKPIGTKPTKLE